MLHIQDHSIIPSIQVLVPKRRSFPHHKMFEFRAFRRLDRAKLQIFSTLSVVAICFLVIFEDSFISNFSLHSVNALKTNRNQPELQSPEFEILKSTRLSLQFESRVEEFLGHDHCKIQFFMTWISPASSFGEREFLAMESLFKAHPHGCLMIISRTMDSDQGLMILNPIIDHGFKVVAVTPDLSALLNNTPAESWFDDLKSGNKDPGEIPLAQNLSNLIRLAVLYKYGGVYLDTDFIIMKDFSGLRNSIGAQSNDKFGNWTRLNNAVLVFDKNHPLLYKFMEEFASTFDGNKWGHNGPYLVSRVVSRVASRQEYNFTVLPPMAFYPVYWTHVAGFFMRPVNQGRSKWVEAKLLQLSGETYGVHLWNKQSNRFRIEEGSVMERLISDHCIICKHVYSSSRLKHLRL